MFPPNVAVVPFRFFFPLNHSTVMLLALTAEITEPLTSGHPQTVYNSLVYPLKIVLNTPAIDSFWFEVVHGGMKGLKTNILRVHLFTDPFLEWERPGYLGNNLKRKAHPSSATHLVPLFYVTELGEIDV
jgi:hypothetical protein